MPESLVPLTDEEMEPDQPEPLRREDSDAVPGDDFPKMALDSDIINDSHEVERVLDDEDFPPPDVPPSLDEAEVP
jgi:hypothetical protein